MRRLFMSCALALAPAAARADDLPRVEVAGVLAWDPSLHGGWGGGAGARGEVTLARPAVGAVRSEIALGFGAGWLYFPCPYGPNAEDCPDANAVWAPLGLAWSFRVHPRVALFAEPGVGALVAFFREACPPEPSGSPCATYGHFAVRPVVALGASARIGPIAVVVRAGFPTFSLGLGL